MNDQRYESLFIPISNNIYTTSITSSATDWITTLPDATTTYHYRYNTTDNHVNYSNFPNALSWSGELNEQFPNKILWIDESDEPDDGENFAKPEEWLTLLED